MAGERAMETELKFKLKAGQGAQAEHILASRHPDAKGVAQRQTTTYFDTPDLAVSLAGFTLRVRQAGDGFTQTVKSAGATGGRMAQRSEKEWPVRRARPDFRRLAGTPLAGLRARVVPLFVTDIRRTSYLIPLGDGAMVEVAIDDGAIRAGDRIQPVRELEIELKSGPVAALYAFATAFHAALPLEIATESKAARGYRLVSGGRAENQKAGKLALAPGMSLAQGIQAVVGHGLAHLTANLAAIDDIEGLHQARVAIRRLRSALVLFDAHLAPHVTGRFEAALKRFGRVLGEARDWDVFLWEAIPDAERDGVDRTWLDMLGDRAGPSRAHARIAATTLTASGEFTAFILALAGWIENIGEAGRLRETSLSDAAPALLDRLRHRATKRGRHIASLDGEELHDLRKTLKKLRYGSDYLASLYEKKAVKKYRKGCDALQEALGAINDAATFERLLARLGEGDDLHLTPAIGLFAEWSARRCDAALAQLPAVWEAFEAVVPPWG
jgi:triphosphatase